MVSIMISSSDAVDLEPPQTQSDPTCTVLLAQVILDSDGAVTEVSGSDESDEALNGSSSILVQVFHGSDGATIEFINADESVETLNGSTSIAKGEENLQRDL